MYPQFRRGHLAAAVLFASSSLLGGQALAEDERLEELDERAESVVQLGDEVVLGTAEQELKQAPGVSIITAEDIARLGEGGLCLGCGTCTWPNCGFGHC